MNPIAICCGCKKTIRQTHTTYQGGTCPEYKLDLVPPFTLMSNRFAPEREEKNPMIEQTPPRDTEFKVVQGARAFKIVDQYDVVFGSYASREDADYFCDFLNEKWLEKKEARS